MFSSKTHLQSDWLTFILIYLVFCKVFDKLDEIKIDYGYLNI